MKFQSLAPIILITIPLLTQAQTYQVGDTVEDYTFTDYTSGESVSLYELGSEGGVLVLEWFAWWCPFCANAAANVETGISEYYKEAGGNAHGVPVRHITLNVQGGARTQSDAFIAKYGIESVLEDFNRDYFNLFSPSGGQPLFVILNAEPDSPSAAQWEVLYTRLNYSGNEAPDISALMRPVIDSIRPAPETDPVGKLFSGLSGPTDGWYQSNWFGWFFGTDFPLINHIDLGYGFLAEAPGDDTVYFYDFNWQWLFTGKAFYPYFYSHLSGDWLLYLEGSMGEWFYDYKSMGWLNSPPGRQLAP